MSETYPIKLKRRVPGPFAPEVDEAFVEKWARKIFYDVDDYTTSSEPTKDNIIAMLREVGVVVKEGK